MKKFLVIAMCLMLALPLFGCDKGAPKRYEREVCMQVVAGQSFVSQNFAFPASATYFAENGQDVDGYLQDLTKQIRLKVWNVLFLNYYAIYSQNPVEKFAIGKDQVAFSEAQYNPETDRIEFSFRFNSYAAWSYYHPSSGEDEDKGEDNLFLDIDESNGKFVFSQAAGTQTLGDMYAKIIEDCQKAHFSQDLIDGLSMLGFRYDYVTYHKRIHSNADAIVCQDGYYYHHIWQCQQDELKNEKIISLTTVNANRGWWYLVILGGVLVGVGVACGTIWLVKKGRKKQKNEKAINN